MADMLNDGQIKVTYVPTIADISAPTVTELTAGTDLECLITALEPSVEEETVTTPKLCETVTAQDPGRTAYSFGLTFVRKDEETEDLAWESLPRLTSGYLVFRYGKDYQTAYASGDSVQVYPGKFGEQRQQQPENNSATQFASTWFVNRQPDLHAVVAAAGA